MEEEVLVQELQALQAARQELQRASVSQVNSTSTVSCSLEQATRSWAKH